MAHKTDAEGVEYFDVTTFLWHVRCFIILSRPFVAIYRFLRLLISWKHPKVTFGIWLTIFILSSLIPAGYTVIIFMVFLGVFCGFGMLHYNTQVFVKLFPDQELEASALQNYLQRSWGEEQKILDEYRSVLYKIDQRIEAVNSILEAGYSILKWEKPLISFGIVMTTAITSVLLCVVDLCVIVFIFNNIIFLGSGVYYIRINKSKIAKGTTIISAGNNYETVGEPILISKENSVMETDNLIKDVETEHCENAEEGELIENNEAKAAKEFTSEGSNPTVIQKIMELRRRHQNNVNGVCSSCQTSLMTLLKRKYTCCNCGNQFCWKCCNNKVPKSFLGVTAPATRNDTVLLCTSCHLQLHDKNS